MPDADWHDYVSLLARLSRVSDLSPSPARARLFYSLETQLIAHAGALTTSGQIATALEEAAAAGANDLVAALPPVGEERLAHLKAKAWASAAARLTLDKLRLAIDKGLDLDWTGMNALLSSDRRDLHDLACGIFSEQTFWLQEPMSISIEWFHLKHSDVAADFLSAQVRHHPVEAARSWRGAMLRNAQIQAVAYQAAGAVGEADFDRFGRPEEEMIKQARSNHEEIAIRERCRSLEALHAFYSEGPRRSRPGH